MRSAARIAPSNILNFASTLRRLSSSEHVPPNIRRDVLVSCFRANRAAMSATTIERSNTTPKQPGGITGKGFVKGDPRINRKGRPRSYDQLRKLAQAIANETTTDNAGNQITTVVAILRSWARSKQPSLQIAFVEIAFGKPPRNHEHDGDVFAPVVILRHAHEEFSPSVEGRIITRSPHPHDPDSLR